MWRAGNSGLRRRGPRPPRQASGCRGFTLVEMLVVLLLLGLLYGLATPLLSGGSAGLDLKAASRQLVAGLRKARSIAVAEHREAALTLDVEARSFSVTGDAKVYALPKRIDLALFTAQSELVRDKTGNIRFFADGTSTGGRVSVSLGETREYIDIDWVTGRVRAH